MEKKNWKRVSKIGIVLAFVILYWGCEFESKENSGIKSRLEFYNDTLIDCYSQQVEDSEQKDSICNFKIIANDKLFSTGRFLNGSPDSCWLRFDSNGKIVSLTSYDDSSLVGTQYYTSGDTSRLFYYNIISKKTFECMKIGENISSIEGTPFEIFEVNENRNFKLGDAFESSIFYPVSIGNFKTSISVYVFRVGKNESSLLFDSDRRDMFIDSSKGIYYQSYLEYVPQERGNYLLKINYKVKNVLSTTNEKEVYSGERKLSILVK